MINALFAGTVNQPIPGFNRQNVHKTCFRGIEAKFRWLYNSQIPLIVKVSTVAFLVLGSLALGIYVGQVAYGLCALTGMYVWARVAWTKMNTPDVSLLERLNQEKSLAEEQMESMQKIKEMVGGDDRWNNLPVHALGQQMGDNGALDFLQVNDLNESLMKGTDSFGRPFISIKLRFNGPAEGGEAFVVTLFQLYIRGGIWVYATSKRDFDQQLQGTCLDLSKDEGRAAWKKIIVDRNHPILSIDLLPN